MKSGFKRRVAAVALVFSVGFFASFAKAAPTTRPAEPAADRTVPEIKLDAVPLSETLDFLRDFSGMNIFVNWKNLETIGVSKNLPVTISLHNVKFWRVLRLVLDAAAGGSERMGFDIDEESGVILITSAADFNVYYNAHYARRLSKEDLQAEVQLDQTVPKVALDAVALSEVIDFLRDTSGANIFVNYKKLEAVGVDRNAPVTLSIRNTKLSKVLQLVLDAAAAKDKLGFEVNGGVITISTLDDLQHSEVVTRTYDVSLLFPPGLDAREHARRAEDLVKLITGSVAPASWTSSERSCKVDEKKGEITVVQTAENHKAVQNLIVGLDAMAVPSKPHGTGTTVK